MQFFWWPLRQRPAMDLAGVPGSTDRINISDSDSDSDSDAVRLVFITYSRSDS